MSPRPTQWGTYSGIADTLRERIRTGELQPGAALPSEAAIGTEFGISRSTVRRALAVLEAEKLVRSRPGKGRIVAGETDDTADEEPVSMYRRIAGDLKQQITAGALRSGDALPSEAAIVAQYDVSRGTARQALSDLEGSGLITAVHGKGRFVK